MKVYTNTVDTIVAEDKEDLRKVCAEHYGDDEEFEGEGYFEWVEVDQEEMLLIYYWTDDWPSIEKDTIPPNAEIDTDERAGHVNVMAKAKDWAKSYGRGFLCSTEY